MTPQRREPYPSALWRRKGPRWFLLGYLGLIVVLAVLDHILADVSYLRLIEILSILSYGIIWLIIYKASPHLFEQQPPDH